MATGYKFQLLNSDGTRAVSITEDWLYTWGQNSKGRLGNGTTNNQSVPVQIGSLTNWKQIITGLSFYTAAIKSDGTLWACGYNTRGQLGNGATVDYSSPIQVGSLTNWSQIAGGLFHTLSIKTDGTLWAWGDNSYGNLGNGTFNIHYSSPIQIGALTNWKQVAGGMYCTVATKTDGTLWAWGHDAYGQLGNGVTGYYSSPIQVGSLTNWKQVASGAYHIAAIKTDGTLWTWGYNQKGQLGNGTTVDYSSPIQVGSLTNWSQVSAGYLSSISIKTDGTLWTWGYNQKGQLGNGTTIDYSSPIQIGTLTNWKQANMGLANIAAIKTDGTLWTCGYGTLGALGNSSNVNYSSPIQIGSLTNWSQVSALYTSVAAIFERKTPNNVDMEDMFVPKSLFSSTGLWGCGYNDQGQLGITNRTNQSAPIIIDRNNYWNTVSVGADHTVAVKSNGTLWSWGRNFKGALGNGNTISYSSPIQIGSLTNWKNVSAGYYVCLAIKTDGTLWGWGGNYDDVLTTYTIPNGLAHTASNYSSPIQIGSLTNWKQVAVRMRGGHAIKTDGTLWGWGLNEVGEVGNGNRIAYNSPVQIGSLTNWKQVKCGMSHVAAIKTDGTLWAWGSNSTGSLGNGNNISYSSPIQIGSLTNWLSLGFDLTNSTAAIKTDGTLWLWGYNNVGQLGNGTTDNYSSPIQIGSLTNWKQVSISYYDCVGLKTDGTIWTWGYNLGGSLGIGSLGSNIRYSSPVQVGSLTNWKYAINSVQGTKIFTTPPD